MKEKLYSLFNHIHIVDIHSREMLVNRFLKFFADNLPTELDFIEGIMNETEKVYIEGFNDCLRKIKGEILK